MRLAKYGLIIGLSVSAAMLSACTTEGRNDAELAGQLDVPSISEATMKEVTKQLSDDSFEGRAPGSAGEEKATAYLVEKFRAAGLEPGNDGEWFQKVPLVEITGKNFSPLRVTGANGTSLAFSYGDQFVAATYQEQANIDIENSDMVFVGYGINAPEKGWNDYEGLDVKGKTVLILINDPDFGTETLDGPFGGKAMTYYGRWTYKYEEAARQGAAAALIIHDTAPAAYGWNVVNSSWTGPQFYAQSSNGGADQTKANGWVQKDVAAQIFKAAGLDFEKQLAAAKKQGFKAQNLNLKASLNFANDLAHKDSKNVVGILKGKKRPNEYIIYSGHWDHLGRCTPAPDGDDICNGAIDNATGSAALVALAEAHVKAGAPDRSIIFLAVTAEESGLLGSKYYAENPVYPLSQTVGGVNMDAFSLAGMAKNLTVVGLGKSELDTYLAAAAKAENRKIDAEPTPEKGFYYRSDHFSFAKLGVPMIYFEGGLDLVNGGVEAGRKAAEDYEANRYHGPKDEYNPDWDWSGAMADLRLYYRIGRAMAMGSSWPNWVEGDEFRAIRDKSRGTQ